MNIFHVTHYSLNNTANYFDTIIGFVNNPEMNVKRKDTHSLHVNSTILSKKLGYSQVLTCALELISTDTLG